MRTYKRFLYIYIHKTMSSSFDGKLVLASDREVIT